MHTHTHTHTHTDVLEHTRTKHNNKKIREQKNNKNRFCGDSHLYMKEYSFFSPRYQFSPSSFAFFLLLGFLSCTICVMLLLYRKHSWWLLLRNSKFVYNSNNNNGIQYVYSVMYNFKNCCLVQFGLHCAQSQFIKLIIFRY